MRRGITLIDVLIALAIGSVLTLLLYGALAQTSRVVRFVDALTGITTDLLFAGDRLSKDIQGAFVPIQGQLEKSSERKEEAQKKEGAQDGAQKEKTDDKQKKERMTDVFIVNDLSKGVRNAKVLLTFISSNPLIVYGESTPRVVRVVYMLEPNKEDSNLFELIRYESLELPLKTFKEHQAKKSVRGYPLLTRIRQIAVTAIARKTESEEEKKEKAKKQETDLKDKKAKEEKKKKERKPPEWERVSTWNDEERIKEKKSIVPESILIKGVMLDERKREVPFEFLMPIAAALATPIKVPEEVKPVQKPTEGKSNDKEGKNTQAKGIVEMKKVQP